jgi:hypothetical protein
MFLSLLGVGVRSSDPPLFYEEYSWVRVYSIAEIREGYLWV